MKTNKGSGSVVAVVIVIIVLLVGAFYLWRSREANTQNAPVDSLAQLGGAELSEEEEAAQALAAEAALSAQGTSDELGSIESDLGATSFDAI